MELRVPRGKKRRITEPPLKTAVRKFCNGKNAGPSGWTEELIRDAITSETEQDWLAMFEDIASAAADGTMCS